MKREPKKPIPLDYARPGAQADPSESQPAYASVPSGFHRGTLPPAEATVALLETVDRGDMAFATRGLDREGIPYYVGDSPEGTSYKHPLRLLVRAADAEKTRDVLNIILVRRLRAKKLNQREQRFKTVSEGGTWPDPFGNTNGGGFFGGSF
jgi:hypothetical protein